MAQIAPLFLLLLLFNCTPVLSQNGSVNGFISFAATQVVVDENTGVSFTTVRLPLVREVGSSGNVFATVDVSYWSVSCCDEVQHNCTSKIQTASGKFILYTNLLKINSLTWLFVQLSLSVQTHDGPTCG